MYNNDIVVNGVKVATSTGAHGTATDTKHGHFNDTAGVVEFGRRTPTYGGPAEYYHGYMAEVIFLDGYFSTLYKESQQRNLMIKAI